MSTPMTPSTMLHVLKAEGLTVNEYPGWRDRCRCHTGSHEDGVGRNSRGWGTVNGTVTHITAGDLGGRTVKQYIASAILGDPNIPCKVQVVVDPKGEAWLVSAGRCNHAGQVGSRVQSHMVAADFSLSDDYDDRWRGNSADGNSFTYGIENITSKTMSTAQYNSSVKINAAFARFHGWSGQESVGHGEISSARYPVDPGLDMGKFRKAVMAQVKKGTATAPPKPPVVTPSKNPKLEILSHNIWGYGEPLSSSTQAKRLPLVIDMIDEFKPHMFPVQEASDTASDRVKQKGDSKARTPLEYLDYMLSDMGYTRDNFGSDGRYVYRDRSEVNLVKGKTVSMLPKYKGDDKQAAVGVYERGRLFELSSFHTENEDKSGRTQAKQIESLTQQAYDFAKPLGVDTRWQFHAGDANNNKLVLPAFKERGFVDSATRAPASKRSNEEYRSVDVYLKTPLGERIDFITVYKDVDVTEFEQIIDYPTSDHNPQRAIIQL